MILAQSQAHVKKSWLEMVIRVWSGMELEAEEHTDIEVSDVICTFCSLTFQDIRHLGCVLHECH